MAAVTDDKYLEITDLQYAPDADYTKLGILNGMFAMVPTYRGSYKPAYAMVSAAYSSLTAPMVGGAILKWADGTVHLYGAQSKRILEANGSGGWNDRSAGGIDYSTMANCQFAAYGSVSLACSLTNNLQASTGASFSQAAANTKAQCIAVMSNAVLLFNVNTGSAIPDGWMSSDLGDYTNFTAAANNAAASGRLLDTPGPVNAAATMNDQVIAWKSRGMYLGRYVGGDLKWVFQLLNADVGCVAPDAWIHTDLGIVFVSERDIFLYDGGAIRSIAAGRIRNLIFASGARQNPSYVKLQYDASQSLVYVFVNTTGSPNGCDRAFIWNHTSDKWGIFSTASGIFGTIGVTYVQAVVRYANYADATSKGVSTNTDSNAALVFSSEGTLANFSGSITSGISQLTTGVIARPGKLFDVTRVVPLYLNSSPPSDTMAINYGYAGLTTGNSAMMKYDPVRLRFDGSVHAAAYQVQHTTMGEVAGYRIRFKESGEE